MREENMGLANKGVKVKCQLLEDDW